MSALKDLLTRAEKWPADAQEDLLLAALVIESSQAGTDFELDDEDYKILLQRKAENAEGLFASEAEINAIFARYRVA
jgi:hypothetical protein